MVHEYILVHVKFFQIVLDAIFIRNQGVIFQIVLGSLVMQLISHTYIHSLHTWHLNFSLNCPALFSIEHCFNEQQ